MTDHEKSRNHYEKSGIYDQNMEHFEECEVNSGAWVLVTRQIPVDESLIYSGYTGAYQSRTDLTDRFA